MTTELATKTEQAAAWLADRSPRQADGDLVSLAQRHGVSFKANREITFAKLGPRGEMIPAKPAKLFGMAAIGAVNAELADRAKGFLTPAPGPQIERWLAELSVIAAKRADDDFTEELRLVAYSRRLAEYPADIVRHVLLDRTWKFWPTWDELHTICEALVEERRAMVSALSRGGVATEYDGDISPRQERQPATADERKKHGVQIGDLVAEMRSKLEAEQ